MADKNGLVMIGVMLCAATLMVMTIGGVVVRDHLSGRLSLEDGLRISAPTPSVER